MILYTFLGYLFSISCVRNLCVLLGNCAPWNLLLSFSQMDINQQIKKKRGIKHMILAVSYPAARKRGRTSPVHIIIVQLNHQANCHHLYNWWYYHKFPAETAHGSFLNCGRRSDWFQAVGNYGCCFHCFLSCCDSTVESSKWLWVMSWWPGNTYC